ncbi:MAG: DNA internalization-related competence protein ComEC/Rec2 [Calditrichia bacterium]|nr:DNA internalization-related competence protein ComEC/Rec2 [Calditrichia bacterium]
MQINIYKYPFVIISVCFIIGIITGPYFISFPYSLWSTILFFLLSLFSYWTKRTKVLNIFLVCAIISAAILRYHLAADIFPKHHIINKNIESISCFEGLVIDYQYKENHRNKYLLKIEKIYHEDMDQFTCGKVLLYTKKMQKKFKYGDRIRVKTILEIPSGKRNPGQFDYRNYLLNQNIFYIARISHRDSIKLLEEKKGNWFIQMVIIPLRKYCQKAFNKYFDDQTAGLIMALILGEKQELDRHMIDNFKKVGVVHVLAISGLHVGFIITFIFSLLSLLRLNYHSKIWGLLIVLIIYIILVRFKTPVIRASSMAILYLLGQVLERKTATYNIIFAAMTMILLFDPRELFNPGFHFSFMAVLSIIYGYDKLNQLLPVNSYIEEKRKINQWLTFFRKWIWMPFLVSFAAVIGTSPLTLYYYGMFPVYALLANLIVIPLTGIIVFLSLFLLFISVLSDILSSGIAMMIQFVNQGLQLLVDSIANLPFALFLTPIPTPTQIGIMYLLIVLALNIRKKTKLISLMMFILVLIFVISIKSGGEQDLQVAFLDVGQGDAAFLRFPNQQTMLIDAGNRSFHWDQGSKTVLPFLQSVSALHINYLVGSHAHNDHIGGFLALINAISIDTLVLNGYQFKSKLYTSLLILAKDKNIPVKTVFKGDMLSPDPSCRVYVLHPDSNYIRAETFSGAECNNSSVVLKVQYGVNSILFMGDLEKTGEQPLLQYDYFLESEILKIGHHGSSTSSSDALLEKVNPLVALISVAKKNKFRHPSPRTLERLRRHGIQTYQTSREGAVLFTIGPEKITKIVWK